MTKLIEKAQNNASAYEKRSEYCDRELTKADLEKVTQLDPLRLYPYRYRAAGHNFFFLHLCLCSFEWSQTHYHDVPHIENAISRPALM